MPPFNFKKAAGYIPHILLIGVGIGSVNYLMNGGLNWLQWSIQSCLTSFVVGYSLVTISANRVWFFATFKLRWFMYLSLLLLFCLIGTIATEVEHLLRSMLFSAEGYQPFTAGKTYLINGIISVMLGFSFFLNKRLFPREATIEVQHGNGLSEMKDTGRDSLVSSDAIQKVPIKKGSNILLISVDDIAYFEAYDNCSLLFDVKGQKSLCDYSLRILEQRLGRKFLRVHRKYIVNSSQIKKFRPYGNGRYQLFFDVPELSPIISSKSYAPVIRNLVKIE